jgi:hypothetical protein
MEDRMAKKSFRPVPGGMVPGIVKGIVLFVCILSAVSCDFPQGGGVGSLTVLLPAGNSGGGSGPGKSFSYYSDAIMAGMRYELTLTGPGETITQTVMGGSVTLSLEPGVWTIDVDAYSGAAMTGSGSKMVTIVPRKSDSITINMVYTAGLGNFSDYYIHNEAELRQIGDSSHFGLRSGDTITFKLANDLSVTTLADGQLFSGPNWTLDGQGHTITFTVNEAAAVDILGLFTNNSGTIQNLTLAGSITLTHSGGGLTVGAIAGQNLSTGIIKNVASTVAITTNSNSTAASSVGGIAGDNNGTIQNCRTMGVVDGTSTAGSSALFSVGGIAGDNNGTIEKCYTREAVNGRSTSTSASWGYVGGIAGYNHAGAIRNCYTRGDVTAETSVSNTNGMVGGIAGNSIAVIEYCYATGTVYTSTLQYAGGIVGYDQTGSTTSNCAALNSKVSAVVQGRISGYPSGGTFTDNYAYANMQVGASSVSGSSTDNNGADISDATLQDSSAASLWNNASVLNWSPSPFQTGPSTIEPVGSPWYWSKTITIPGNLVVPGGLSGVRVPALWFEP